MKQKTWRREGEEEKVSERERENACVQGPEIENGRRNEDWGVV